MEHHGRIDAMAARCKNRGGDCPCREKCEALRLVEFEMAAQKSIYEERCRSLNRKRERLTTPMATLKEGFVFDTSLGEPCVHFDGDDTTFGYIDDNGDWVDSDEWPFNPGMVWWDDCERLGIRWET